MYFSGILEKVDKSQDLKDSDLSSKAYLTNIVLRRALALSMLNDLVGISELRDLYLEFMKDTGQEEVFNLVTRPRDFDLAKNPGDVRNRIGEIDLFDQVLKKYTKKKPDMNVKK